jgi:hypothetical protein
MAEVLAEMAVTVTGQQLVQVVAAVLVDTLVLVVMEAV